MDPTLVLLLSLYFKTYSSLRIYLHVSFKNKKNVFSRSSGISAKEITGVPCFIHNKDF